MTLPNTGNPYSKASGSSGDTITHTYPETISDRLLWPLRPQSQPNAPCTTRQSFARDSHNGILGCQIMAVGNQSRYRGGPCDTAESPQLKYQTSPKQRCDREISKMAGRTPGELTVRDPKKTRGLFSLSALPTPPLEALDEVSQYARGQRYCDTSNSTTEPTKNPDRFAMQFVHH